MIRGHTREKLRRQHLMAAHITVFVMTNRFSATRPFYSNHAAMRLPYPTAYTPDLIRATVPLLERLYRPGFHYQKCGVMLMDLSPAAHHRGDLFDTRDQTRQARLMRALDQLNADYGARTVHVAYVGKNRLGGTAGRAVARQRALLHMGVPGVIRGKFSVRKIATKSPSVARHDYI
jgi:DNA polymerase V